MVMIDQILSYYFSSKWFGLTPNNVVKFQVVQMSQIYYWKSLVFFLKLYVSAQRSNIEVMFPKSK